MQDRGSAGTVAEQPGSISVVVPCFNRGAFLGETLQSALAQTRQAIEVIVVDDGSSDRSVEVAKAYPVKVIELGSNRGISAALNTGIRAARGALIALLDSDDLWEPYHLETVAGLLDHHPEAVVAAGAAQVFGERQGVFYPRFAEGASVNVFDEALRTWVLLPTASVMRRSAVLAAGGYFEGDRDGNDYDLILRLAARDRFVATHRITAHWRRHPDQLSAGYLRQIRSVYRHRHRFLRATAEGGAPRRTARIENMVRQIWTDDLTGAWQNRDWELFRTVWECRSHVPRLSTSTILRWQAQRFIAPVVEQTWDRLRYKVRSMMKRPLRRAASQRAGGAG